jgi:hypothetical protein
MYVNGEEVFLPRIRTRHVSQSKGLEIAIVTTPLPGWTEANAHPVITA